MPAEWWWHQYNDELMSVAVAQLLQEVLLLPVDARMELVEAILEQAEPTPEFVDQQMGHVFQRMAKVKLGTSTLIPAEEAHERVLASLKLRA
jgi:hypothetical protein